MTQPTKRRRSPGEGSVYRAQDGWRGAVSWTDPDGRRHRRVVRGATAAEARAKLDELRATIARARRLGIAVPDPSLTLGAYLAGWIERYRPTVRPATWRTAEMHVRCYLTPSLGAVPLSRLSIGDVEAAMASWLRDGLPVRPAEPTRGRRNAAGVSPQTVRHVRATLRRALADAVRDGLLARNVASDARPPYAPSRPIVYLAPRDLAKLFAATADDDLGTLWVVLGTLGLRLGEALALTWGDVDLAARTLRVRHALARDVAGWRIAEPKTVRSRRTLPLPARAVEALARQRDRQRFLRAAAGDAWQDRLGLVFTDPVGRPLRPEAVSRVFRRTLDRVGLPRVRLHDLRHSAATALLGAGVPLSTIADWLGHASVSVTAAAYAAVTGDLLRDAAAALDRTLDEALGG